MIASTNCGLSTGADPGFQVRGGGALKKIAPSGGRCENFWGISCGKSRFYAKKSYFFSNFRRGASPPGSAPAILLNMMSLVRSLRSSSVDYS
jgi:hypothetical protein